MLFFFNQQWKKTERTWRNREERKKSSRENDPEIQRLKWKLLCMKGIYYVWSQAEPLSTWKDCEKWWPNYKCLIFLAIVSWSEMVNLSHIFDPVCTECFPSVRPTAPDSVAFCHLFLTHSPGLSTVGLAVLQNLILEAAVLTRREELGSSVNIFKEWDSMSQWGQSCSVT